MATNKTLGEALRFFLEDGYVDRLEAEALLEMVEQDGQVTPEEREFLGETLRAQNFDGPAVDQLKAFLETYEARTGEA